MDWISFLWGMFWGAILLLALIALGAFFLAPILAPILAPLLKLVGVTKLLGAA